LSAFFLGAKLVLIALSPLCIRVEAYLLIMERKVITKIITDGTKGKLQ
jgi:hypothetical protein